MSLINQVLKDLDEREPLSADKASGNYQPVNNDPQKPTTDWLRLAVWGLVAVCVTGAAGYWFYLDSQAPAVVDIKPMQATLTQQSSPAVVQSVSPDMPVSPDITGPSADTTVPTSTEPVGQTAPPVTTPQEAAPEVVQSGPADNLAALADSAQSLDPVNPAVNPAVNPVVKQAPKQEPEPDKVLQAQSDNSKAGAPIANKKTVEYLPLRNTDIPSRSTVADKPVKPRVVVVKSSKTTLESARELLRNGRLTEAEQKLAALIKKAPLEKQPRELLIGLLLRNSRTTEAEKQLADALRIYPRHENFVLLKASLLLNKNDTAALLALLEAHLQSGKAKNKSLSMLASLYQQQKNFAGAAQLYNRLAAAEPKNGTYWVGLATSLEAQGQLSQALKAFQQALQSGAINHQLQQYALQRVKALRQQVSGNE